MCTVVFTMYVYNYLSLGGVRFDEAPPQREMLCKRCVCVRGCDCVGEEEWWGVSVRSPGNSLFVFFLFPAPRFPLTPRRKDGVSGVSPSVRAK